MLSDFQTLRIRIDNRIAIVTLNRPSKLNALNLEMMGELNRALEVIGTRDDIRALIMTGAGEKAFAAGADIGELHGLNRQEGEARARQGQSLFEKIESFPHPVVAALQGYALGGGAELALACHLRFGTDRTIFGLPETGLGLLPGFGGTQRLTRLVGPARALDLILTGRHVASREALEIGLLNRLVPRDELMIRVREWVEQILEKGPLAITAALKAVRGFGDGQGYAREASLFGELCGSRDAREGTTAFLEKRTPEFRGE